VSRQKKRKFAENLERENVLQPGKPLFEEIRGNWHRLYFKNQQPITIELGCGRGEYTIGLSQEFTERNYVGIDLKGDRIWKGSGQALELGLKNVAFLRLQIQFLERHFAEDEVDEIWLTFPDPRPRDRDEKHRLSNAAFMEMYRRILTKDGWFRFKTDNTDLFDYTLDLIKSAQISVRDLSYTHDLYQSDMLAEHRGITTKYEKIFSEKGEKIKYMKFRFAC